MDNVRLKFSHVEGRAFTADPAAAQQALDRALTASGIDALVVTSQDAFLSEYNTLANSQRYALTGFTGSTGDGIFLTRKLCDAMGLKAQFVLFVDGRYHLQVDGECDPRHVEVVKFGLDETQSGRMADWLKAAPAALRTLGLDGSRASYKTFGALQELCDARSTRLQVLMNNEVQTALKLPGWEIARPIVALPREKTGRSLLQNVEDLAASLPSGISRESACMVTCMSDDLAWLLNARGFHLPHSSAALGYCFVINTDVVVFLPQGPHASPVELPERHKDGARSCRLTVVQRSLDELKKTLAAFRVSSLLFDATAMNAFLPKLGQDVWSGVRLIDDFRAVSLLRARKTPEEIQTMRESFLRSSRGIAETLRWVKASTPLPAGKATGDKAFTAPISERDMALKLASEFKRQGAVELSFRTISGTGANAAVIHYGGADPKVALKPGEMALLDCGMYCDDGFATDTTRVVFCGGSGVTPEPWQRTIYTVVLKAFLACRNAVFERTLGGAAIDAFAREVCRTHGYDYIHGTGHGVGIHVHESGHRISRLLNAPLIENGVISIEPGIYLEGKGGVRLENVAVVRALPDDGTKFFFDDLVWIGYDWDLVDVTMLTPQEKSWLIEYERRCAELGTTVTKCPLS